MIARARLLTVVLFIALVPTSCSESPRRLVDPSAPGLRPFESAAEWAAFIEDMPQGRFVAEPEDACVADEPEILGHFHASVSDGGVSISGVVSDDDGNAVASAQVTANRGVVGALTGQDGSFRLRLDAVDSGAEISVSRIGYGQSSIAAAVEPGDSIVVRFELCEVALMLQEVVPTGVEAEAMAAPSITNVQHEGVDEGGIVKLHGEHLVVLRRGRLFTVDVGPGRLAAVDVVDASGPSLDAEGAWYDELLVSGDDVVVIGYSYARRATEVGIFRIDADGRLHYRDTYQLRSGDYYSSRNYASRLVDGRLVFYAPLGLYSGLDPWEQLPSYRRWRGDDEDAFEPMLVPTSVYHPGGWLERQEYLALHTVTTCEIAGDELGCSATSIVGPWGRVSYVSPRAVYVWVVGSWGARVPSASMLYRLPLGGGPPSAIQTEGAPVDQFSFLEEEDGDLLVVVRAEGLGEGMWGGELPNGQPVLLRIGADDFGDGRRAAPRVAYGFLPRVQGDRSFHNRFVNGYLLYGNGSGWRSRWPGDSLRSRLVVSHLRTGITSAFSLPQEVNRIEVMGEDAVVVGRSGDEVHFTAIDLGSRGYSAVGQSHVRPDASEGELRSHGFFYRNDGEDLGVLALPLRGAAEPGWSHLVEGSASMAFVRNAEGHFSDYGELRAAPAAARDDLCKASCVDWYGNARPIFIGDRVFALMGYEVVEGAVRSGRIEESRRVDFSPRPMDVR